MNISKPILSHLLKTSAALIEALAEIIKLHGTFRKL